MVLLTHISMWYFNLYKVGVNGSFSCHLLGHILVLYMCVCVKCNFEGVYLKKGFGEGVSVVGHPHSLLRNQLYQPKLLISTLHRLIN